MNSRRGFLGSAVASVALAAPAYALREGEELPALARPEGAPEVIARDEAYWRRVAAHYAVSPQVTNLEAGFWGMMAAPVMREFFRQTERVNRESSFYARGAYLDDLQAVRVRAAKALGADVAEIAFTRGATEAMQCLIGGYNKLRPGDTVLYADLDYPGMQWAMKWLADRRGARPVRFVIPEPASRANVLAAYEAALDANPGTRLLLTTHVNNKTGLMTPVAQIAALARARGVDTITDAAHSFGQVDIKVADLGVDFAGFNLHKWIGAPVGVGVLYIRRTRLADIDRMMGDEDEPADSITSRVHSGTANFATMLSVPAALDFHEAVGPAAKAARVRHLRELWVNAVRDVPGIEILTPDEPGMCAAITSFRLADRVSKEDTLRTAADLRTRYSLFTVRRTGIERGDCVRVTPALYNRPEDVARLAAALRTLAAEARA
jgi:isopenicillin-N epimerase